MEKNQLKSRMKNLLMFLPNMVVLTGRLMVDSRVPRTERAPGLSQVTRGCPSCDGPRGVGDQTDATTAN